MHRPTIAFLSGALLAALISFIRLRRDLATTRRRGDMYRDIATGLERQRAQPVPESS